jgi:hypothetical protein
MLHGKTRRDFTAACVLRVGMRLVLIAVAVAGLWGIAAAKPRAQLTWEGYVTDGADLLVQGEQVDAQGRTTGAVDRPRISLASPLPAVTQTVTLEVRRGGGRVEIVEQPSEANDFSLIVRIDPRGRRAEFYSLQFRWKTHPEPQR